MFRITYDPEAKAMYIYYKDRAKDVKVAKTVEVDKDWGIYIDYDKDGNVLGVELLNLE